MKLSIFLDEISPDPARAIELASRWQVPHIEVRGVPGGRFPRTGDAELEEYGQRLEDAGLQVSGVSPGLFKCPLDDPSVPADLEQILPRACEWARRLGTRNVSSFAFRRGAGEKVPAAVVEQVGRMAEITRRHGCRLTLENEAVCWGATGVEAVDIIRRAGSDNLALLWDPGNSARAGSACAYPDEYEQCRDRVAHVHLKNFDPETGEWALIERGAVDWEGQLRALRDDGYRGFLVVETHLRRLPDGAAPVEGLDELEANSLRNLDFVRARLGP